MQYAPTVRFESEAITRPEAVAVARLTGVESISRPFSFELELVCQDPAGIDDAALLTKPVTILFERDARATLSTVPPLDPEVPLGTALVRKIHGMVASVRERFVIESKYRHYTVLVAPRLWRAHLTTKNDIYMDMSVPQILERKLEESGLTSDDFDLKRLASGYPKREFVVQYRESDLAFMSRLAEDIGIAFHFAHQDGRDVVVFTDSNQGFSRLSPEAVGFTQRGLLREVYELEATRRLVTTQVVARDYNYRNPSMDVSGRAELDCLGGGRFDEFGAHVKNPTEATDLARLRAEEIGVDHFHLSGLSGLPEFYAGGVVGIENHPLSEVGPVLLTMVRHQIMQATFGGSQSRTAGYSNEFEAIPLSVPYRPARLTPKPVVSGALTAIVEHPTTTQYGAVDPDGRYRVSFMFDSVSGRGDAKASRPVRMAQPSAGADRGFHLPLKPGTEVILTCVNGDPDRPIITGAMPNPQARSPVGASNNEKSVLFTNRARVAIDDRQPRVRITVGEDDAEEHVLQMGAPNAPELGIAAITKGNLTLNPAFALTSISSSNSSFTDSYTCMSSGNVVSVAGQERPLDTLMGAVDATTGVMSFTKGLTDLVGEVGQQHMSWNESDYKKLHNATVVELRKSHDASPRKVETEDGTIRQETAEEVDARLLKEHATNDQRKALQAQQDLVDWTKSTWHETLVEVADVSKGFEIALKAAEQLGSKGVFYSTLSAFYAATIETVRHKLGINLQEAARKCASESAGGRLGLDAWTPFAREPALNPLQEFCKDLASKGPIYAASALGDPFKPSPDNEPVHMQAAAHTAALIGDVNAFIHGTEQACVASTKTAALIANGQVHVKAGDQAEISSTNKLWLSSKLVDAIASETALVTGKKKGVFAAGDSDGFGLFLEPKDAWFGKLKSASDIDKAGKDDKVTVHVCDDSITLTLGDSELKLESDNVAAAASSKFEAKVKSSKVLLDGDATIDGDSIKLG
ncbi:MAG: type VI secretion system tip protein TssI/VgrG [Polyangiaceae bacterium]